ncbi:MAG: hypothetical protein U0T81_14440 [Saprospiraceae bacterium]
MKHKLIHPFVCSLVEDHFSFTEAQSGMNKCGDMFFFELVTWSCIKAIKGLITNAHPSRHNAESVANACSCLFR